MQTTDREKQPTEQEADELVRMLDRLMQSGTQHVNLTVGEQTHVQTVNSTECNPQRGACAQPNAELYDDDEGFL